MSPLHEAFCLNFVNIYEMTGCGVDVKGGEALHPAFQQITYVHPGPFPGEKIQAQGLGR